AEVGRRPRQRSPRRTFLFSSRRRHTRFSRDWSSDVCSSDLRPEVLQVFEALTDDPRVQNALAFIEGDHAPRVEETLELVQIPASPFNEHHRAQAFARRLESLGLDDVHIDEEGNALGYFRGASRR